MLLEKVKQYSTNVLKHVVSILILFLRPLFVHEIIRYINECMGVLSMNDEILHTISLIQVLALTKFSEKLSEIK